MSDEIRMTLLHHSTNDLIEELLMWRGLAAERLDRIAELEQDLSNKETEYTDLWDDALALYARIAELEEERRWIPVSERLPDTKIVYDKFDVIVELVDIVNGDMIRHVDLLSYDYRNKSWNDDCGEFGFYPVTGITHWRERPTPPEVQE